MTTAMHLDPESCYRAVKSRDRRFDGVFYTAVRTTGIYCRPSCPARTPAFHNVTFHPTAAAAQAAGYRACKRCLPDATPGSPDWDVAADAAGRAMRLIADGVVDREGVDGLAQRIGYTPRHLSRLLTQELGAGPLALARAKRAQTARVLLETTDLGAADVAFAAGFSSVRQFNDTIREVYAATPTRLRGGRGRGGGGALQLRLAVRTPFAGGALLGFLALRAVPGVEAVTGTSYTRTLRLPHGTGAVGLDLTDHAEGGTTAFVPATFRLDDLRDLAAAVERARRLLDADCDPVAIGDAFAGDPVLGPLVREMPGLRVPGHVDGDELAVRAVLGQQVTVPAARTTAGRLTEQYGEPLARPHDGLAHLFPTAAALAAADPESLPMPRSRGRALVALCRALADGEVRLDRGADRDDVRRRLLDIPGIGPWTAGYIALRALGHPDVFLPTDIGIRDALRQLGRDPATAGDLAEAWRPWRSYAQLHLWQTLTPPPRKDTTEMWTVTDSPVGELRIVERDGAITAIEFSPFRDHDGRPRGERNDDHPVLAEAVRQLRAYFARDLKEFDLPLDPSGSDFQKAVWAQLLTIGYGDTASYGEIARRLGKSNAASRAVGLANGSNPIPIVIPCHRVIGADGTLTGYAGGIERKQTLLELEQDALF